MVENISQVKIGTMKALLPIFMRGHLASRVIQCAFVGGIGLMVIAIQYLGTWQLVDYVKYACVEHWQINPLFHRENVKQGGYKYE